MSGSDDEDYSQDDRIRLSEEDEEELPAIPKRNVKIVKKVTLKENKEDGYDSLEETDPNYNPDEVVEFPRAFRLRGKDYFVQYSPTDPYTLFDYLADISNRVFEGENQRDASIKSAQYVVPRLARFVRTILGKKEYYIFKQSLKESCVMGLDVNIIGKYGKTGRGTYTLKYPKSRARRKNKQDPDSLENFDIEEIPPFKLLLVDHMLTSQKVVNDPFFVEVEKKYDTNNFNLFPGFKAKLVPGMEFKDAERELAPILDHIYNVWANGDEESYLWIIELLTYTIRTGKKPMKMLILMGKQGVGKSIIMDFIKRHVIGEALYTESAGLDSVTRKFNAILANKIFVCINESATANTDKEICLSAFETLKQLVTGDTIKIEPKGVDPFEVFSYICLILFSNNPKPISMDEAERRYGIFRCCEVLNNKEYFIKLRSFFSDRMGDIFYTYARLSPKKGFCDLDVIPKTQARRDLVEESKLVGTTFFTETLTTGETHVDSTYITVSSKTGNAFINATDFYQCYLSWHKRTHNGIQWNENKFKKELKKRQDEGELVLLGDKTINSSRGIYYSITEFSLNKIVVLPISLEEDTDNLMKPKRKEGKPIPIKTWLITR